MGLSQLFNNKTTYIFDFVAAPQKAIQAMVKALKAVLEDATVAKVVHDCRQVWQQCASWLTCSERWSIAASHITVLSGLI